MYRRILLKLTGELFADADKQGIEYEPVRKVAEKIAYLTSTYKIDLAIVLGAGNLFRGRNWEKVDFDRATADYIGMTGTIMNGLALKGMLDKLGVEARLMSSIKSDKVCEEYLIQRARAHLKSGKVIILVGGLGRPYSTTDTTAAQMAAELNCEVLLKGSGVDGIYTADPKKDDTATRFETLSFHEALISGLMVMDDTAFALCKTNNIPIIVFNINDMDNIERIIRGEKIGTIVS